MLESELKDLIKAIQSFQAEQQVIEVKRANGGCPEKLFDTLSSFSNQDEGGTIVFGLDEQNGFEAIGVYDAQDLQKQVTNQCNQMEPKVRSLFTVTDFEGVPVVSAEVPSVDVTDRPCFYKGKGRLKGSYRRVGESDEPMTEYEIYSYEAFRKKHQDDIRIVADADVDSLSPELLADYLQKLKAGKANLAALPDEKICQLMNLVKSDGITLMAEMLFGLYPQAFVPQLCIIATVIPGNELGEVDDAGARFVDNRRIEGTIPAMLNEALAFVRSNMKMSTYIDPNTGLRSDNYEYPLVAIREILLNALIHRDYSIHTEGMPIQIIVFRNRIEIISPGGLYGRIRMNQLGKVQPDTRNPALATAMEVMKLTENRYSGIPTIRRLMKEAGLPEPEFIDTQNAFKVILRNGNLSASENEDPKNRSSKYSDKEEGILNFCESPRTREEIAELLGISSTSYAIARYVMPLVKSGRIAMSDPEHPRRRDQTYKTV